MRKKASELRSDSRLKGGGRQDCLPHKKGSDSVWKI